MLADLFVRVVGCLVILDYEEHVSKSVMCRLNTTLKGFTMDWVCKTKAECGCYETSTWRFFFLCVCVRIWDEENGRSPVKRDRSALTYHLRPNSSKPQKAPHLLKGYSKN